jgi:PhnB protein
MLAVADASAAARWYAMAIGATQLWNLGGVVGMSVVGAPFFLGEPEVFVDDPDAFIDGAVAAGADGTIDQIRDHEVPWGTHRQGGFIDPFGHLWLVGDRSPLSAHPGP